MNSLTKYRLAGELETTVSGKLLYEEDCGIHPKPIARGPNGGSDQAERIQ
jgi:hypothetical protein